MSDVRQICNFYTSPKPFCKDCVMKTDVHFAWEKSERKIIEWIDDTSDNFVPTERNS